MSLYNSPLSKIYKFGKVQTDEGGFQFGYEFYNEQKRSSKILYSMGCSWLNNNFFKRCLLNNYPEYMLINRAVGGQGNSMMIDILEKDLDLLDSFNCEVYFLLCFTEVGRNKKDFTYRDPRSYTSANHYCGDILKEQYKKVFEMLEGKQNYISTSFIPNNFNSNKTILDFCGRTSKPKPEKDIFIFSTGNYEAIKTNKAFKFTNVYSDVEDSCKSYDWLMSHEFVDETAHPSSYLPYELFLENLKL